MRRATAEVFCSQRVALCHNPAAETQLQGSGELCNQRFFFVDATSGYLFQPKLLFQEQGFNSFQILLCNYCHQN